MEFGYKTAAMLGAELSGDRELSERNRAEHEEEARMRQAARARDWRGDLASLSFDERVAKTMECLDRRASFKSILYGLLVFCFEERSYEEVEEHAQGYAEFEANPPVGGVDTHSSCSASARSRRSNWTPTARSSPKGAARSCWRKAPIRTRSMC